MVPAGVALVLLAWAGHAQDPEPSPTAATSVTREVFVEESGCPPTRFDRARCAHHESLMQMHQQFVEGEERWLTNNMKAVVSVVGTSTALTIHLWTLVVWGLAAPLRRFHRSPHTTLPSARPRAIAAAVIAVSVGFFWSVSAAVEARFALTPILMIPLYLLHLPLWAVSSLGRLVEVSSVLIVEVSSVLIPPDELRFFYPRPLFIIAYLAAGATLYVLYLALRSWRKQWWTPFGRVHYSVVAIALAWYPFHLLVYWRFIP